MGAIMTQVNRITSWWQRLRQEVEGDYEMGAEELANAFAWFAAFIYAISALWFLGGT